MENKYLLKALAILPQFIFKRVINFLSNHEKNKNSHKTNEEDFKPEFGAKSKIAQRIYENYFNEVIPAYGISLEIGNSSTEQFSISRFFEINLGWLNFNLVDTKKSFEQLLVSRMDSKNFYYEESLSDSFKYFLKDSELDNVDICILSKEISSLTNLNLILSSNLSFTIICVSDESNINQENFKKILETCNYLLADTYEGYKLLIHESKFNKYLKQKNIEKIKNELPVVNIVSNLYQDSEYAESFFDQIKNLSTKNYRLGKVCISVNGTEVKKELKTIINKLPYETEVVFDPDITIDEFYMDQRVQKWTMIFNNNIRHSLLTRSDYTIIFESDLTFPPDTIDFLIESNVDVVAPLVILGGEFYDSWGFRHISGERIYDLSSLKTGQNLTQLGSVGSFLAIKTEYLNKSIRLPSKYENDGHLVGLCNRIRKFGGSVYCRSDISVIHPTSYWLNQLWDVEFIEIEKISNNYEIVKKKNFKLPGYEDVFVYGAVNEFYSYNKCHFVLYKLQNTKSFQIYCFRNKNELEEYKYQNFTAKGLQKELYLNKKESNHLNYSFILE